MRLSMCYRLSPAADQSGLSLASAPCRMPLPSTDVVGGMQTYGQLTHSSVPSAKT